ncbi:hypothetical protein ABKV19_003201 [Rosa sericea]
MKKRSKRGVEKDGYIRQIDWELRPGGMLVQKRDSGDASSGPMIKIKVSHDSYYHDVTVHCRSTFGDLKRVLANETGLEPKAQRLLYRGKEKDDVECLHIAGVKDMSKIMLLEDPASKEKKLEEMNKNQGILKAYEEVAKVRAQVDKLSQKVAICCLTKFVLCVASYKLINLSITLDCGYGDNTLQWYQGRRYGDCGLNRVAHGGVAQIGFH